MANDLGAPLTGRRGRKADPAMPRPSTRQFPLARVLFSAVGLLVAGLALRVVLTDQADGGRPFTEIDISAAPDGNPLATAVSEAGPIHVGPEVPVAGGPSIIRLDDLPSSDHAVATTGGEPDASGMVPELLEDTQFGPIPRLGPAGETPFATYSRAQVHSAGKPLVAVVVTGLGLNETGTLEVIEKLPPEVTLAFAPYGKNLERTVGTARADGHEILLEVPLEPFDYPDNDPGPQTLLTGQPPRANLDKLVWLMARFGGYVGLVNHMGARFTASGGDFSPFMEELGARGLGYLDDGSSNRSLAPQLAGTNKVPFARADMMLDANPAKTPILAALEQLAQKAKTDGRAIGMISALPISMDVLTEWSATLADKGVELVAVSALMK